MKEITFPEFNLKFDINNIAFEFVNFKIYWYAIFIVASFVIGIYLAKKDNGKYGINFEDVLDLLIILIPISIISARIYYVLFNLNYYLKVPKEILKLRDGGLAIYGGIIGAIICIFIFSKYKKIDFLNLLDYICPFLPLGQAIGRLGNFTNVEAHGYETNNILRMGIFENNQYIEVHPTFLYEALCDLTIFILLYNLRNKRTFKGEITYLYFCLYGLIRIFIEGLRTDSLMLGNIRVSQVLSIILFIIFGTLFLFEYYTNLLLKKKQYFNKINKEIENKN